MCEAARTSLYGLVSLACNMASVMQAEGLCFIVGVIEPGAAGARLICMLTPSVCLLCLH